MACKILVLRSGPEIEPCPLQWKHGALTTGLLGKSLQPAFYRLVSMHHKQLLPPAFGFSPDPRLLEPSSLPAHTFRSSAFLSATFRLFCSLLSETPLQRLPQCSPLPAPSRSNLRSLLLSFCLLPQGDSSIILGRSWCADDKCLYLAGLGTGPCGCLTSTGQRWDSS